MVKISRGVEPNVLLSNKIAWKNNLMSYVNSGMKVPSHVTNNYNNTDIKNQLRNDSNGKCMYCESPIAHVTFEHIEHIKPKASHKFPELCFEWENLGIACPRCNMNKTDHYDNSNPFINPYIDDPSNHLLGCGAFIFHKGSSTRGEVTINIIQLNRPELLERRAERMKHVKLLIDRYHSMSASLLKDSLLEQIKIEIDKDMPYSLCTNALFNVCII